jgi:hypothetical protein
VKCRLYLCELCAAQPPADQIVAPAKIVIGSRGTATTAAAAAESGRSTETAEQVAQAAEKSTLWLTAGDQKTAAYNKRSADPPHIVLGEFFADQSGSWKERRKKSNKKSIQISEIVYNLCNPLMLSSKKMLIL